MIGKPFTVVLDPGHGGAAAVGGSAPNNAVGPNGLLEKELALALGKAVVRFLPSHRVQTVLTREDDRNLSLQDRAAKARETGSDVFVSIHFNGHADPNRRGAEAYVSEAARPKDRELGRQLMQAVSLTAGVRGRGVQSAPFGVLRGDRLLPKTAACLLEVAYLSNPGQAARLASPIYVDQLGLAIAQAINAYAGQAVAQGLEQSAPAPTGEQLIYDSTKEHADPPNFPINLPEAGSGEDTHRFSIPAGLKFSRWEVEVLASSPAAGYRMTSAPKQGAEGEQSATVAWSYLPYGKLHYRLRAYASPDGQGSPAPVVYDAPGWTDRARDYVEQGLPVPLAVKGDKAKLLYEAILKHQTAQGAPPAQALFEPVTITIAIVAIVVIGLVIALGMITLGALLKMAMDKGYDIKDTKYSAKAGEGATRQEHEMVFNLTKPK